MLWLLERVVKGSGSEPEGWQGVGSASASPVIFGRPDMVCRQLVLWLNRRIFLPQTPAGLLPAEKGFRSIRGYSHFLLA